jgi:hypothetical protein
MSETSRQLRSVSVPVAQAVPVFDALLATLAAKAGALSAAAGGGSLTVVHDARRELAEAEDALDTAGWRTGSGELELTGAPGLVREVLYAALVGAVEACAARCRDYEAGLVDRAGLAGAVADVRVLHGLFDEVEAAEAL